MGRSKRHFKGNNKSNDRKRRREVQEEWQSSRQQNRDQYVTKPENERFEAFYQTQLNLDDEDWESFMRTLKSPLPACFRINPQYPFHKQLKAQLQEYAGQSQIIDGVEIAPVKNLEWYPNGDGYKLGTDRRTLRKSDELEQLHKWIVQHTENGHITRQEAVSMVPPLALNVAPHHKCLDMCAAPGSKTSQLLEVVMTSLGSENEGIVIANDADTDRAYMLVHQCRRINSPLLMVTTHKGQEFPTVVPEFAQLPSVPLRVSRASGVFDRVLCDVPCSGDGTLRKTPNIWAKWGISSAASLYPLQLQIAERGLRLVKHGGLLVYSTCSMSPYEDEAVVAELLRTHKGTLELIDAREFIPHFKCRPGLTNWLVLDDSQMKKKRNERNKKSDSSTDEPVTEKLTSDVEAVEESAEQNDEGEDEIERNEEGREDGNDDQDDMEVVKSDAPVTPTETGPDVKGLEKCLQMGMKHYHSYSEIPENLRKRYKEFIFPPTSEEIEWMHLERCLRCLPQDEDTGGFFVCAMRRLPPSQSEEISAIVESETKQSTEVEVLPVQLEQVVETAAISEEVKAHHRPWIRGAHALVDFTKWDTESFLKIKEFFGLVNLTGDEFYIREDFTDSKQLKKKEESTNATSKSVYYLPAVAQSIMKGDVHKRLKIVSAGIKVLERSVKPGSFAGGGECGYRLLQEGIDVIAPFLSKRVVQVPIQDLCNFIEGGLVSFSTLSKETCEKLLNLSSGSVCVYYEFKSEDIIENEQRNDESGIIIDRSERNYRINLVCWRGNSSAINVMVSKLDTESLKHQLQALGVYRPKVGVKKGNPEIESNPTLSESAEREENEPEETA